MVVINKAILLNSGGLDTLISARIMREQGWELSSLYFDMGQLNNVVAQQSAQRIADQYCTKQEVISISVSSFMIQKRSGLFGIPFQSQIIMVLGASYAFANGYEYIVTGQKNDSARKTFYPSLMEMLASNTLVDNNVIYIRPVENLLHFKEVLTKGKELGLSFEDMAQTVSCNIYPPCGICHKCKEREELGI